MQGNVEILKKMLFPYKENTQSGLLSVKVEGNDHLVKIYIEYGIIVGMSMGALKNELCLDALKNCKPVDATFIKDCKAPSFTASGKTETNNKLEEFFGFSSSLGLQKSEKELHATNVSIKHLQKLEQDVTDILGPITKILIDSIYAEIGYSKDKEMSAFLYKQLIDKIKKELPREQYSAFLEKYMIKPIL